MDPIDRLGPRIIDLLCRLAESFQASGLSFAVVGATAFLLNGIDLRRTTRDLDLAVAMVGGLEAVRPFLHNAGLEDTRIEHRFRTVDGDEIDVLAIDPERRPLHEVLLADGGRIEALGLPDAVVHATSISISEHAVPVAPLCLLIAIKLCVAASGTRPHDLEDACAALEAYELQGPRRFTVDYDRHEGLTYETAGAFLAGTDTVGAMSTDVLRMVDERITSLAELPQLSAGFAQGEWHHDLVLSYQRGIRSSSNRSRVSSP